MIDLAPLHTSITLLLNHLTNHYGPRAELETYVICTRVKSPDVEGGSGISWIVGPDGQERAGGLLQDVLRAVDANGSDQS